MEQIGIALSVIITRWSRRSFLLPLTFGPGLILEKGRFFLQIRALVVRLMLLIIPATSPTELGEFWVRDLRGAWFLVSVVMASVVVLRRLGLGSNRLLAGFGLVVTGVGVEVVLGLTIFRNRTSPLPTLPRTVPPRPLTRLIDFWNLAKFRFWSLDA